MPEILVLGATGYTGRLVCAALADAGAGVALGGRRRDALERLQASLPGRQTVRQVDVTDPDSLKAGFKGVKVVVNTVGPFLHYGEAVVSAAIQRGVHYVDTTAEQGFQQLVCDRHHSAARSAGVAVITAQAVDFAPACLGAHLLNNEIGPLEAADSWHWLDDYKVSRGTAQSAVGMLGQRFTEFRDGRRVPLNATLRAVARRLPFDNRVRHGVPFPGGDAVLLPAEIPSLRQVTNALVLPRWQAHGYAAFTAAGPHLQPLYTPALLKRLSTLVEQRVEDPDPATRARASWTVVVRGQARARTGWIRIVGHDVYGSTGAIAAAGAMELAANGPLVTGAVSAGAAFEPSAFLDQLASAGVSWRTIIDPDAN